MDLLSGVSINRNKISATEDFQRCVRDILNKLVPQTFGILSERIVNLQVDTTSNLECLALMIYEKAVREPLYCPVYAQLCYFLTEKINPELCFKSMILGFCHEEFHRDHIPYENMRLDVDRSESLADIKYQCSLSRMRKFGNIYFIGELLKSKVISDRLIVEYIGTLLNPAHVSTSVDIQLESLCKLLSVTGMLLDTTKNKLVMDRFFATINEYYVTSMLSIRIKYALLDVIELRENKWVPRFVKPSPVTLDRIRNPSSTRK